MCLSVSMSIYFWEPVRGKTCGLRGSSYTTIQMSSSLGKEDGTFYAPIIDDSHLLITSVCG